MKLEELIDSIYDTNKDNPGIIKRLAYDFNVSEQRVRDIVLTKLETERMTEETCD